MTATHWGPPIDVLPLLAREEQALVGLLTGLDGGQWSAPTACAGWTVHDLVAHILGDKLGRLSRDRDGYHVDEPRPGEAFPAFLDRINGEWVLALRRLSPEVLFAMLVDSTSQLTDLWKRLDLDELGGPVSWAGPGRRRSGWTRRGSTRSTGCISSRSARPWVRRRSTSRSSARR